MIKASNEFKNKIKQGCKVVNYADIVLKDGTKLFLEPADFTADGFTMTDKTSDGKFGVGFAIGKTINLTIANHTEKFSMYDFYQSIIYMYVAVTLDDGTVLKERKGKYYVISPSTPGEVIVLSGVDSMHLFDKPYNPNISYPATLQTILLDCCYDCGVMIGFGRFDMYNFTVNTKPENVTYRQVVSYVAQIAGYNARISNDDYLELVWYDTSFVNTSILDGGNFLFYENADNADGGNFIDYSSGDDIDGGLFTDPSPENITKISSLSVGTDDILITGVMVKNGDTEEKIGEKGYVISVEDNPLTEGAEREIAEHLASKLISLNFRKFDCETTNNPLYEPFDTCYTYDRKGNAYFSLINSIDYSINGFTRISCLADDPVRNESSYISESAKAIVEARRNTQKQLTTYDKAVQNMNLLAANSMGLYRESELSTNGSVVYFMSNRPITKDENGICIFETKSVVYKMTGDGFFVSRNGGKTFVTGFDSYGNAVVNVLSAIGITFDWARGGTLSLGGDGDVNGILTLLDSNKNVITRMDNDGLTTSKIHVTGGLIDISSDDEEAAIIKLRNTRGDIASEINPFWFINKNGDLVTTIGSGTVDLKDGDGGRNIISATSILLEDLETYSSDLKLELTRSLIQASSKPQGSTSTNAKFTVDLSDYRGEYLEFHANDPYGGGYLYIDRSDTKIGNNSQYHNIKLLGKTTLSNDLTITNNSDVSISGNLSVSGTKSRVAPTEHYSDRLLYCYEMAAPYFGDIGEGITDENGVCYIHIDDILGEVVNTDVEFHVFLQPYGKGNVYVAERTPNYFVVKGTSNLEFAWELKAKQKGYEYNRIEKIVPRENKQIDYEMQADSYINNYYKEMMDYEKNN